MAIAAFSTVVEWYDFTLYLYLVTILSRLFFGGGEASVVTTLGGFAIAYLMRPVGAILFGHIGDRYGRRRAMLGSMALMTVAMLATALLPTRDQIGPSAGVILILLRCVMAFAVGGEYTGVVAYLIEGAAPRRRGLITSSASAASEIGALLAVGISAVTVATLAPAALDSWGWRIPFLVGAGLAGSVLIARASMDESPEFERQRAAGTVPANPIAHVARHHRAAIARGFAISALGSISYYVGITYVPAFLTATRTMGEADALGLSTIAAVVVIAVTPFVGLLSDRIGRRPVLIAVGIAGAALPIALFGTMAGAGFGAALAGAVALAGLGGAVSAVGAVATAELLPGEGRLSGLAFGATGATAIFGGVTPWLAHLLIERTGSPLVPGMMIAAVALCVLPILWRMPETRPTLP
ncbi:MFS transporter [Sphingomonas montanisoli]|uniref:MFS transporter n=2 Tax=Sphingomonas montanisoli TaxID=2606412 RepID=A0A5D9C8W0_9SPHN|nr:MFS transporter [Sphingomonas montanisoli]